MFRPIVIDADENIMIQKSVGAAETGSQLDITSTSQLNDSDVSRLETLIYEFDSDRQDKETACRDALGLGKASGGSCDSPSGCAGMCSTTQCQQYGYASELLGYWIYDYAQNERQLDMQVSDVKNVVVVIKDTGVQDKEIVMRQLNAIMDRTLAINVNPLMSESVFGVCKPIDYDNAKIREMMSILGTYGRRPVKYTYAITTKFVIAGKDYTELKITDTVPQPLRDALLNISVIGGGASYIGENNTVDWPTVKLNLYPQYMLGYEFDSGQGIREDIFENWPTPRISTKIISLSKSPTIGYILATSNYIYGFARGFGYYAALAAVLAFWDIAFFLAVLAAKAIISFVGATFSRTGLRDSLLRAFGGANPYWKEYAAACAIFLAIGYAMLLGSAPVSEDTIALDRMADHLIQNPLGAGALLFIFLGLHIAYALLEDRFKGVIAGRRYYENILEVSPKANALRFNKMKEKIEELRAALAAAAGIDVSEEKNVLISVPAERIEILLKKEGSERAVRELIDVYTEKLESALTRVGEKQKISADYWPEWSKEIAEKLGEQERVPFTAFITIPSDWRLWAANRFVSENAEEGLKVEGEELRRAEAAAAGKKTDDVLKKLVSKDMAIGGAILRKDGIEAISSRLGNKTLEGILAWKVANYAKTLGQKVLNSDYKGMVIVGAKNAVAFTKGEESEGVLFAPKDRIKDAFPEFEAKLKRL
ncbi:Uncharacterised protein [uncultured archaeon]|nr:Uncharacterised protein [uncultured archaeon]